ncbi:uncharacterized protein LOC115452558 [Manduca sexta]|uniref:uncharacterized protein LOC115452558 n=1 Tax=Manduca sexta TaxID=7130 RepID=UPI00188FEF38|nr:uncharacterized protein LOC115452558 [Manduca sexta]KAG6438475.1 hypothetical protein O3G_MSEX000006 [Manduca sexta]
MWHSSLWSYLKVEGTELLEWAKCGDSVLSTAPTFLWAAGAAALAQRLLNTLFRRFMFRRVPMWELVLQNLLFIWIVIYSLHFWFVLVKIVKVVVEYCYTEDDNALVPEDVEGCELMKQWVIWMCGVAPLFLFIYTRPRPEAPPLMIWITTSPWQRREMGAYGYYLSRPPALQSASELTPRHQALVERRAFSDSKIVVKTPAKKRRYSKSI